MASPPLTPTKKSSEDNSSILQLKQYLKTPSTSLQPEAQKQWIPTTPAPSPSTQAHKHSRVDHQLPTLKNEPEITCASRLATLLSALDFAVDRLKAHDPESSKIKTIESLLPAIKSQK
ncbi:hypothetical protein BCR33DRAFT_718122 [Rhizoclosmatium globosum]|uniref:Uncharacterized protein n=1 Tax=Rhizoclosmatium globosum TaxID=329046 RepID=A0A1Y2C7M9_9FUNG|nr:hypothetical protein BCR33DRAFT_718116 [Rhizoclosmatium globosum]ORY42907.1 hypothetical protein BCR33DRAFT_718122 [Rhizoclosmatium globosum]|eukprot:ORY42896.1 hypothetical protein BCR33DRAFT_718116 [Rhizoclosmatium globosum]